MLNTPFCRMCSAVSLDVRENTDKRFLPAFNRRILVLSEVLVLVRDSGGNRNRSSRFVLPCGSRSAMGKYKRKKAILFLVLLLMLMPLQATLLPTYIGLRDMHMLNSPFALILPMLCSPFAFYLMYQYVETVPTEIVEAARLETSSLCKILWHALLPQIKGSVAAVFVFMFAEGFNMVEQPLYFVKEDVLRPLSVIAEEYIQGKEQLLYAVGVLCLIPILLLYAVYEEELSDGMGRLKG